MKNKNNIKQNITVFFRENRFILILLIIFFIIKIYFITSRYHMPIWDEAVYIGMGKYIYSLGTSGLWEMIRPYGLPIIIGALWSVGLDPVYFSQVFAIIFSCATIFMTYLIAKELFDKRTAILSAFLLLITPVFFLYSIYALTEIPSTFFVLLALYYYLKGKYFYSGISTGIALLFRFPQGLVLVPIGLTIIIDWIQNNRQKIKIKNKYRDINMGIMKKITPYAIGFFIILLPFLVINYVSYNEYTSKVTDAIFRPLILAAPHQSNVFESVGGNTIREKAYNIFYYIIMMLKNNILFLLSIAGTIVLLTKYKDKTRILVFTFLIYLAYYSYIINKQERFMITFLPMICILTAYFLFYIIQMIIPKKSRISNYRTLNNIITKSAMVSLIIIALILTSLDPIKTDIEYYYWLYKNDQKPAIIEEYYSLIDSLNINGPILISEPVIAAYTNKKLIEYTYYEKNILIANEWEADEDIAAVTYTYNTIPCLEEDEACNELRESLLNYFITTYDTYYKGRFFGQDTYLFLRKQ